MVHRYNTRLEQKIRKHRLIKRIGQVHQAQLPGEEAKQRLDRIDAEGKNYMKNAERKCRKIKSGHIPFSLEAAKWIRRVQVLKSLMKYANSGRGNRGNLHRAAYRAGIISPFRIWEEDLTARIKVAQDQCGYYRRHGKHHRKRHLKDRLEVARQEGNEDAEQHILGIIKRERKQAFWRRLKYSMASWKGGSVHLVQVEDAEGNVKVLSTQQEVHEAIWSNIHRTRFFLAEEAPICKGTLRETFGYNADTEAGDEVLDGTFWYDQDFDQPTKDI